MALLDLIRQCRVLPRGADARVVCERRRGVSAGWCARIYRNPDALYGLWFREYLAGVLAEQDGRPVKVYAGLEPGFYEAHSTLTARKPQSVCFRVTDDGRIVVLGAAGDEDVVIALLNGMTVAELHDARDAAADDEDPDGLAPLRGSLRQVAWAARIRVTMLNLLWYEFEASRRLSAIEDANWFIRHRFDGPDTLLDALASPAPPRHGPGGRRG